MLTDSHRIREPSAHRAISRPSRFEAFLDDRAPKIPERGILKTRATFESVTPINLQIPYVLQTVTRDRGWLFRTAVI
jgi:hypothetical protein